MPRTPDPTRMLSAALFGEARRLASEETSIAEARRRLEELAHGRYDLISREAGLAAGCWSVSVTRSQPVELLTAGLLAVSGPVDLRVIARWVEVGRKRASAPIHRAP